MEAAKPEHHPAAATALRRSPSSRLSATAAGLAAAGLGGAALLVWWALAFQPANARLWMVPAGLVLLGTPVLAWISFLASGHAAAPAPPPPPPDASA